MSIMSFCLIGWMGRLDGTWFVGVSSVAGCIHHMYTRRQLFDNTELYMIRYGYLDGLDDVDLSLSGLIGSSKQV